MPVSNLFAARDKRQAEVVGLTTNLSIEEGITKRAVCQEERTAGGGSADWRNPFGVCNRC